MKQPIQSATQFCECRTKRNSLISKPNQYFPVFFKAFLLLLIAISVARCTQQTEGTSPVPIPTKEDSNPQAKELRPGSICTVENGDSDSTYGVVKVLVINAEEAHIKIYKNKFDQRPAKVDIKTLSLGSINDKDGFGIGHVPLAREGFDGWKPVEVDFEAVTEEDLEGYNMWKNQ